MQTAAPKFPCVTLQEIWHDVFTESGTLQLTFTCSKSAIETLEKNVKYVQSLQ